MTTKRVRNHELEDLYIDTQYALIKGRPQARKLIEAVVRGRHARDKRDELTRIHEFMQFFVGAYALESAIDDGELNEAADWIMWSLADDIRDDQVQDLEPRRIQRFLDIPVLCNWPPMADAITVWLTNFYYYARRRAAMRNIGEALWGFSRAWLDILNRDRFHIHSTRLGAMMLGWAAQENEILAADLTPAIEKLATDPGIPVQARATLAVALATRSGRFSKVAPEIWAQSALGDLGKTLLPHERLQMLTVVLSNDYDDATFDQALRAIDLIPPRTDAPSRASVANYREMDAMPDLALALCTVPLNRGDIDGLIAVLERWYRVDTKYGRHGKSNVIVFAPFFASGFRALGGGKLIQSAEDPQKILERIASAANIFYSTSNSVIGADNSALHVPDRFGVPEEAHAALFEEALGSAFCPAALVGELADFPVEGVAQLQLAARAYPVQAVQLHCLGRTWPIVASLQPPLRDRPIRRVVVWSGAGSMSEAMEVEAIQMIFERSGAKVEVHAPEVTTVDDFLGVYRDPDIDLLWVMSHGEYDHWAPKNVAVQIGHSRTFIQLDDLLEAAPRADGRRLVVFNVCDGARFEELGALPRVGFAPALANSHQAVISQLWPAKGWAAAAFGALLAARLANGLSFFTAFSDVLGTIRRPREDLAHHLADAVGAWIEMCDRIVNSGEDFENFALSSSPAFFQ
jgi:hypothetical protein